MKQYKTVAGPTNIYVGKNGIQSAFDSFADIINKEVAGGWEYHSMEIIEVTEKPGCLKKPMPVNFYMLIFVREI